VYDTAAWMVITALSEQSVAMGGHPVPVPDFTNGAWIHRGAPDDGMYSLDVIDERIAAVSGSPAQPGARAKAAAAARAPAAKAGKPRGKTGKA